MLIKVWIRGQWALKCAEEASVDDVVSAGCLEEPGILKGEGWSKEKRRDSGRLGACQGQGAQGQGQESSL